MGRVRKCHYQQIALNVFLNDTKIIQLLRHYFLIVLNNARHIIAKQVSIEHLLIVLFSAIHSRLTRCVDTDSNNTQENIHSRFLYIGTDNFVCTTTNKCCINSLRLAYAVNKKALFDLLGWFFGNAVIYFKGLLCTTL